MSPTIFIVPAIEPRRLPFPPSGDWGNHFGNRHAQAGDSNRLACLANFFQDAEALGFEDGDGDFLHNRIYSVVNSCATSAGTLARRNCQQKLSIVPPASAHEATEGSNYYCRTLSRATKRLL